MPNVWTGQMGSVQRGWSEEPPTAPKLLYPWIKAKRSPPGPAPTPLFCLALFSEAGQKIALQVLLACADLKGVGPMWVGPAMGEELMAKWEIRIFFFHLYTSLPFIIFFPSPSSQKLF